MHFAEGWSTEVTPTQPLCLSYLFLSLSRTHYVFFHLGPKGVIFQYHAISSERSSRAAARAKPLDLHVYHTVTCGHSANTQTADKTGVFQNTDIERTSVMGGGRVAWESLIPGCVDISARSCRPSFVHELEALFYVP